MCKTRRVPVPLSECDVMCSSPTECARCVPVPLTGFPASEKIMETWKMKKTFSRPGKIMEFEKSPKNLEKSWNLKKSTWKISWNFVSDLILCESNFCHGTCLCTFLYYSFFQNFLGSCDQSVHAHMHVYGLMRCFRSLSFFIFIRYLYPGKTEIFLEKSWSSIPEFGWKPCSEWVRCDVFQSHWVCATRCVPIPLSACDVMCSSPSKCVRRDVSQSLWVCASVHEEMCVQSPRWDVLLP